MKKFFAFVSKHEKMLFLLVTIANLSPIFIGRFFPTLDGPSHLYNSNLIVNLLFNSEGLTPFYAFNPELVPNWSGHFILVLFSSILPSYMAEKILLLISSLMASNTACAVLEFLAVRCPCMALCPA